MYTQTGEAFFNVLVLPVHKPAGPVRRVYGNPYPRWKGTDVP